MRRWRHWYPGSPLPDDTADRVQKQAERFTEGVEAVPGPPGTVGSGTLAACRSRVASEQAPSVKETTMRPALPLLLVLIAAACPAAPPDIPRLDWQERSDWFNVKTDVSPAAGGAVR